MKTAKFVKNIDSWRGDARLYKLSDSVNYGWSDEPAETNFIVVSGVLAFDTGDLETYIFPSDETGEVLNWCELSGSFQGDIDHERALLQAGYELE